MPVISDAMVRPDQHGMPLSKCVDCILELSLGRKGHDFTGIFD